MKHSPKAILELPCVTQGHFEQALASLGLTSHEVAMRIEVVSAKKELLIRQQDGSTLAFEAFFKQKNSVDCVQIEIADSRAIVPLAQWLSESPIGLARVFSIWISDVSSLLINAPCYNLPKSTLTRDALVPKLVILHASGLSRYYRHHALAVWYDPGPYDAMCENFQEMVSGYQHLLYSIPSGRPYPGDPLERLHADYESFQEANILQRVIPMGNVMGLKEWFAVKKRSLVSTHELYAPSNRAL